MLLGNGLYGFGIPFVLGVDDGQLIAASQAFMFGGGFYAAYSYTKNMEIPYGRWQFQSGGSMRLVGRDGRGDGADAEICGGVCHVRVGSG